MQAFFGTFFAVIALILLILIIISNYFVNYSMKRKSIDYRDPKEPKYTRKEAERENFDKAMSDVKSFSENNSCFELNISTFDSEILYAKAFLQENSNKWALLHHGYRTSHKFVQDVAMNFYHNNYNVITPDLRAHGKSGGKFISMGYFESKDTLKWLEYIISRDKNAEVVLYGESMGSATVLQASDKLPENVSCIISDSGYTNAYQMFKEQMKYRFNLPSFPILDIAKIIAKMRIKYDISKASPIDSIKNATIPILFIHGDKDNFVLPYMQKMLYDTYNGPKEKLLVENAAHVVSRFINPKDYYEKLFDFVEKYSKISL